MDTDIGTTTT